MGWCLEASATVARLGPKPHVNHRPPRLIAIYLRPLEATPLLPTSFFSLTRNHVHPQPDSQTHPYVPSCSPPLTSNLPPAVKEASELSLSPSPDFAAAPLESDLFEWHFTLRGPPSPSPFSGGLYHGRIALPPSYPLRPPSFRFLTPSGRFEVNREICLSITGFHEETWQPAWGIRTALVAIRSFMDSEAGGAVGGLNADESVRRRLAAESKGWKCATCGRGNGEIMEEQERMVREAGGTGEEVVETVPEELRLGYRDEMGRQDEEQTTETETKEKEAVKTEETAQEQRHIRLPRAIPERMPVRRGQAAAASAAAEHSTTRATQVVQQQIPPPRRPLADTSTLDKAIYATAGVLVFMIIRLLFF